MNLSTPWEFICIQDQTQGTKLKYAEFFLLISTPERILAEIFSSPSMGGVNFGHSYLYFLYISYCKTLNEGSVEQLFFDLCILYSETSSNDRIHILPESECGEIGF